MHHSDISNKRKRRQGHQEWIILRNWQHWTPISDQIRDQLAELGIILEDSAGVTTWRKK